MNKTDIMNKIGFKKIDGYEGYIMDIPEMWELRKSSSDYATNKNEPTHRERYLNAVHNYLQWFIDYTDDIFKAKSYPIDTIAPYVFLDKEEVPENKFREYLHKSLYLARDYINFIKPKINSDNLDRYKHLLLELQTNIEWFVCHFELIYRKSVASICLTSGGRSTLSTSDIFSAAKELFFIEEVPNIENIYMRDLKPNVMFQIRQLLEQMGKNIIGYEGIEDKSGNVIKKFTQSSWAFIKEYGTKGHWNIEFPINLNTIVLLHSWSNKFVHTSYIYNPFIQFFALEIIRHLMMPPATPIIDYKGGRGRIRCLDYGEIKVYHYNNMKSDFEEYITNLMTKTNRNWFCRILIKLKIKSQKKPNVKIKWFENIDNVGAYIMSLD